MLSLPKPFFVLAPMDDVTDCVFRQIVADCASPDLFMTEFINCESLQSAGRKATYTRTLYNDKSNQVIAQIWGKTPEHFEKSAHELLQMGFHGIDINFGCPEKTVVKNDCCSAMIRPEGREAALELIRAARRGIGCDGFLSVKTRLGFNEIDYSWHELLLKEGLQMLTVHVRTRKEMSNVPANYEAIRPIVKLRDKLAPSTKIVLNGDIENRCHGEELAAKYGVDGLMIGRGIFHDPFAFAGNSQWNAMDADQKIGLFVKHLQLFKATWPNGERSYQTMNKFAKIYINGFDGAKAIREQIMQTNSVDEALELIASPTKADLERGENSKS